MKRVFNFLFIVLTIAACHQDTDLLIPHPYVPVENIVSSVGGIVIDDNNDPIADATVILGTETKETDKNGVFIFRNVEVNSERAYIKVVKAGYFHGSRTILPRKDAISKTRIKLQSSTEIGMVAASTGGEFTLPGGAALLFPANAIVDQAGNTYTSDIHISLNYLNPQDQELGVKMPGNMIGIATDGQFNALTSFGMLAITLTDDNGSALRIANDHQIEIRLPVGDELLNDAPSTIPLWMFDEEEGYWRENGQAVINDGIYVAKISDLAFWNVGTAYEMIDIQGKVIDQDGEPIPNVQVSYSLLSNTAFGAVWSDSEGYFTGNVPANELLKVHVSDQCGELAQSSDFGPFSPGSRLANVTLNDANISFTSVVGRLIDCDENSISNGYVLVKTGAIHDVYYTKSAGEFSATFVACPSITTVGITGVDLTNLNESIATDFEVNSTIDVGSVQVCE